MTRLKPLWAALLTLCLCVLPAVQAVAQYDSRRDQERRDQERRDQDRRNQERMLDTQRERSRLDRNRLDRERIDQERYDEERRAAKKREEQGQQKLLDLLSRSQTAPPGGSPSNAPPQQAPVNAPVPAALVAPRGWTHTQSPSGTINGYVPPGVPAGHECILVEYPKVPFYGTADELQLHFFTHLSNGMRILPETISVGTAGRFRWVTFVQVSPQGLGQWLTLYTAHVAGQSQALVFASNLEYLFRAHAPAAHATVARTAFP